MLSRATTGIVLLLLILPGAEASSPQGQTTRGFTIVGRSETTQKSVEVRLYRKMVAVLIGIDRYEDPLLNLSYAVKDVQGMGRVLRQQYVFDPVYTLLNEEATKESILSLLQTRLRNETNADDAVLVFFSGHGDTVETTAGQIGYLVPHDGAMGQPERNISMSVLRDDVSRLIPARHILFIVDSCYGGLLTTRGGAPVTSRSIEYLQSVAERPARQVLTAGMADQEVLDGGPLGYAVFTGRVVETLRDATDYLTANELALTVRERVFHDAEMRGHQQTPTYGYLAGDGDLVFVPRRRSLADIGSEISTLEAELETLRQAEVEAAATQQAAESERGLQQQAELQERIRRAREVERLEREQIQRQQEASAHARREAERRRLEEYERLSSEREAERLRQLIEEKRAEQETLREGMALDEAIVQAASLRTKLADVERQVRAEVEEEKKLVAPPQVEKIAPLGEFETEQAFEGRGRRIEQANTAERKRYERDVEALGTALPIRIEEAKRGFQAALNALVEREFPINPTNSDLTIGRYNLEEQYFPVTVAVTATGVVATTHGYLDLPVETAQAVRAAERQGLILIKAYGRFPASGSGARLSRLAIELPGGTRPYEIELGRRFSVTSIPTGAEVYVNDELCGTTPLSLRGLVPTTDQLRIEAPGYRPYVVPLDPHGQASDAKVTLEASDWREVRTFTQHRSPIRSVAFSPDGRHALTGSSDNTAKLWEVSTGQEVRTLRGHTATVGSVAFSPDGRYVLTGSDDRTTKLWEVSSGQLVRTFSAHKGAVLSVAFSPDGSYALTGLSEHAVELWRVSSGRRLRSLAGHSGPVYSVSFSPDGRRALAGSQDSTAALWKVPRGTQAWTFTGHTSAVLSVCFSPDGRYVLTGSRDGTAKLWRVATGRQARTFGGHTNSVTSVAFSPDGRHALTGSEDRTAKLWEVESGQELRTFSGHTGSVNSVSFSPDGRHVLTGSGDKTAKLWVFE